MREVRSFPNLVPAELFDDGLRADTQSRQLCPGRSLGQKGPEKDHMTTAADSGPRLDGRLEDAVFHCHEPSTGSSRHWTIRSNGSSRSAPPPTSYPEFIREVRALAMGSSTCEWMLRHVVGAEARRPGPWPYSQPTMRPSAQEPHACSLNRAVRTTCAYRFLRH